MLIPYDYPRNNSMYRPRTYVILGTGALGKYSPIRFS